MLRILGNRILVSKIEDVEVEGFNEVKIQDSFIFKGKVEEIGQITQDIKQGDTVLFSKYSPDNQEVDVNEQIMKIIKVEDVLAII
jgi:co-chaperonin GroES (HSP10)